MCDDARGQPAKDAPLRPARGPAPAPARGPTPDGSTFVPRTPDAAPATEVFGHLAPSPCDQDAKELQFEELVRQAKAKDKIGDSHAMVAAGLSAEDRKRLDDVVAHDEKIDERAGQALVNPGRGLAGLSAGERDEVVHQMQVRRLISEAHDDFDQKRLAALLETLDDPDERKRLLDDYRKQTGSPLQVTINEHTGEDSHYRQALGQLISEDREKAEHTLGKLSPADLEKKMRWAREQVDRLHDATSKSRKEKDVIFSTLEFRSPEEIEAIRRAFKEKFPWQEGLVNELDRATSGDDEREAIAALDQSPDAHKEVAAAALKNCFFKQGLTKTDPVRVREILEKLSPEEIQEMTKKPEEYGDVIDHVKQLLPHDEVVQAFLSGNKALGQGLQIAEDIGSSGEEKLARFIGGRETKQLDRKALFAKLAKMDEEERAAAVAAYDHVAAGQGGQSLAAMMAGRFDDDDDVYDKDRGQALLAGDDIAAKAAQAEGAIDRKGTNIGELEEALSDPDLSSRDEDVRKKALARRSLIEAKISGYGKGSLRDQADDEDKLAEGKDDRVAFDQIMATGKTSVGMQLRRAIKDHDTEKGKELLLGAGEDDLQQARALWGEHHADWGGSLDDAVRMEWGPTQDAMGIALAKDSHGKKSGDFIQMEAVLEEGARETWASGQRASVDHRAHEADREGPTRDELLGREWAGTDYDQADKRERLLSERDDESFAIAAETTESAAGTYGKQKREDAESAVEALKKMAEIGIALFAPELEPLVSPLLTAAGMDYKRWKLGKHYEGEKEDQKELGIDMASSLVGFGGGLALAGDKLKTARTWFDRGKYAGEKVARGAVEGKDGWDIVKDVGLGLGGREAGRFVGHKAGEAFDGAFGKQNEGLVGDVGKGAFVGTSKAAATLPFEVAAKGEKTAAGDFTEKAFDNSLEAGRENYDERREEEEKRRAARAR